MFRANVGINQKLVPSPQERSGSAGPMCVCMCVCTCAHTHTCVFICVYVWCVWCGAAGTLDSFPSFLFSSQCLHLALLPLHLVTIFLKSPPGVSLSFLLRKRQIFP